MQIFFQFDSNLDVVVAKFFLHARQIASDVPVFKVHKFHVPDVHGIVHRFNRNVLSKLIRAVKSVQIFKLFQQSFEGDVARENSFSVENAFPCGAFQIRRVHERTLIRLLFLLVRCIVPIARFSQRRIRLLFLHPPLLILFTPLLGL